MKELTVFEFQSRKLRVIEHKGEPWFIGKEVCEALAFKNHRQALTVLSPHQRDYVQIADAIGRLRETSIISEGGLCKLAFRSSKKEAEAFTDKVVDEILPAIRKTGSYSLHPQGKVMSEFELFNMPDELRKAIEAEEDQILAMTKHVKFLKYGELLRYPVQARTRGKRHLQRPKVLLCEGVEVVQLMISFGENIA